MVLTEQHIDRIAELEDADILSEHEKIQTVYEYYSQATDKDNPIRPALDFEEAMNGRLVSEVQSYDLMDNKKYKNINRLLEFMNESFGFNEDIMILAKKESATKGGVGVAPFRGAGFNETLKSNDDLNQNSGEYLV